MSDLYSPSLTSFDAPPVRRKSGVTGRILSDAASTRPWVLLLSILGFIGTGLMILLSVVMMFLPLGEMAGGLGGAFGLGLGLIYLLMGILYFFPSLYLFRYGKALKALAQSEEIEDLEEAFEHQKRFWKFVGIMVLVTFVVYAGGIILLIGFGAMASLGAH